MSHGGVCIYWSHRVEGSVGAERRAAVNTHSPRTVFTKTAVQLGAQREQEEGALCGFGGVGV